MSKRLFHPRLPHADVKLLLFAPDATRSVTGKQEHNKQTKQQRNRDTKTQSSLCQSVLCQVMWHSSSCSLNELLTPVLRADVSTGKLDSRFPVNKPQVLQIKVCWNDSSCYKSTKLTFHKMNSKPSKHFQKFSKQTGSHPNVNNQPISHKLTSQERSDSHKVSVQPSSGYKT